MQHARIKFRNKFKLAKEKLEMFGMSAQFLSRIPCENVLGRVLVDSRRSSFGFGLAV